VGQYAPKYPSILSGAHYSEEERSLISDWTNTDRNVFFMPKPYIIGDNLKIILKRASNIWHNRFVEKDTPYDQKIISLVNEELAILFSKYPSFIDSLSPRKFEEFIQSIFLNQGFKVELTQQTKDGGYDLKICQNSKLKNELILIEVKHVNPRRPVRVGIVRELYGVRALNKADKAVLVTSSYISEYAKREFSRVIPLELDFVERKDILDWCKKYYNKILR